MLFLTAVGFGVMTVAWVDHAAANDAIANAEPTTVTVVESEVNEHIDRDDNSREYSVTIVYEYAVDGETYESSNVYPGISDRRYSSRSRAQGLVDRYEAGETVTGYVDPDDPDRSYLRERSEFDRLRNDVGNAIALVLGGLLFVGGTVGSIRSAAAIER